MTIHIYLYRNGVLQKHTFLPKKDFIEFAVKLYKELDSSHPENCAKKLTDDIEQGMIPVIDSPVNNMRLEFTL